MKRCSDAYETQIVDLDVLARVFGVDEAVIAEHDERCRNIKMNKEGKDKYGKGMRLFIMILKERLLHYKRNRDIMVSSFGSVLSWAEGYCMKYDIPYIVPTGHYIELSRDDILVNTVKGIIICKKYNFEKIMDGYSLDNMVNMEEINWDEIEPELAEDVSKYL